MILSLGSDLTKREQVLPDGNRLLLLEVLGRQGSMSKEEHNRNVFLLTPTGEIIWRVAYHEGAQGYDPFVSAYPAGGSIIGCTWDGWEYEIGVTDGSLKRLGWTK